jgi:predicted nuclease with TOPRIM domain
MDEQAYRTWWPLHLRVARGEMLNAEEQAVYVEGKHRLHEEEALEASLIRLRQTREEIKSLEAERERLQERRRQLRERVTILESALSEKTKHALGVGD